MSDHALLTQAAKAYGYADFNIGIDPVFWNPLENSHDAFQLMVAMGMRVEGGQLAEDDDQVEVFDYDHSRVCIELGREHVGDMEAATRRAIVRMAALLGENHQGKNHDATNG